jgi:ADP-ribose pyrophosphatase YjhB (NUDIX family)
MRTKIFCNFCESVLEKEFLEGKERQVCKKCGQIYYENPLPVVSIVVVNDRREALLVKREREPAKNMWCFPIGFAESGENIEDAALRELKEEAGVDGRIVQIVDVCSDRTEMYGEVVVVTFEAEKVGGVEVAGDDACDVGYFPVTNLPRLAFPSQEKALAKYIDLKRDVWDMSDSFQHLVAGTLQEGGSTERGMLSDELIQVIETNRSEIIQLWLTDISSNPSTKGYHGVDRGQLSLEAADLITRLIAWLKGGKDEADLKTFYTRSKGSAPAGALEEQISALSILKKHIFGFTSLAGIWHRPVDLYRVLELGERVVYFFDRAAYYLVVGFQRKKE